MLCLTENCNYLFKSALALII